MPLNRSALGKRIQIQRKRRGLSQMVFSELIDKSPTFVSYVENGCKSMSLDTFVDVANALETSPDELLRDSLDARGTDRPAIFADGIGECSEEERRLLIDVIQAVRQIHGGSGKPPR